MKTQLLIVFALLFAGIAKGQLLTRLPNAEFANQKQASFGCGWIDFNGDQKPDPYFTHINTFSFYYENLGESSFRYIDSGLPAIRQSTLSGISWGDFNNDGLNDLFINTMGGFNYLIKNKGNGSFEKVTNSPAVKDNNTYLQSSFVDYDNDGWLDIFAPTVSSLNFVKSTGMPNMLYRNDGSGNFEKAETSGLMNDPTNTTCTAFSDYDNDGDQDVFLTEFFKDNHFYENNGDGTFTKITNSIITPNTQLSLSCSWGDYDNDGFMDLFVCNGGVTAVKVKNYLFHNNGDKTFTKVTTGPIAEYSGCSWSSAWGDLDNDGDLDLYLGTIYEDDIIFLNNGDGTFVSYTNFERNIYTTGVCLGDYDNDGSLDVLIAQADNVGHIVFHNNGNENSWINLTLKGSASNYSGIGAKVKIKATIAGKTGWQYRTLNGNQGLRGFNDLRIHFGLGDAQTIDSLIVEWPSKSITTLTNITSNQFLTIEEAMPPKFLRPAFSADTLIGRAKLTVQFTENCRFDANYPITTWSWDFNGDGVEDSNLPNPVYTFSNDTGQVFSVSLTISNGETSKTLINRNYIQIYPLFTHNVALWNKVSASSSENEGFLPANAIDGDLSTRWASEFSDAQWFKVELDSTYVLGEIKIKWENAAASDYEIQTSTDDKAWKTIFTKTKGTGGNENIQFNPDTAKYVRINLLKRRTQYGFSFYEFEIYRSDGTTYSSYNTPASNKNGVSMYPNPVTCNLFIDLILPETSEVKINVYDLSGRIISEITCDTYQKGKQTFIWNTCTKGFEKVPAGMYFCHIETSTKNITLYDKNTFLVVR